MSPSVLPPRECQHIVRGTYYLADFAPKTPAEGKLVPCEQDRCDAQLLVWRKIPRECVKSETGHLVKPKSWPPVARPGSHEEPSIATQCVECGQVLVLYNQDTIYQEGVTIVKPPERKVAVPK